MRRERLQKPYRVIDTIGEKIIFEGTAREIAEYLGCYEDTVRTYAKNSLLYKKKYMFEDILENTPIKEGYKICKQCGNVLPLHEFYNGRNICRNCFSIYYKKYNMHRGER